MPAPPLEPLRAWGRTLGLRGEPEVHRARPWSLLVRWDGRWLKHCGPAAPHEAAVVALLEGPGAVLPLATAPGMLALPDAGVPLRDAPGGADRQVDRWPALLAEHALLQQRLQARVPQALAAGVPDLRPSALPEVVATRREVPPGFAAACAELAAHEVGATVQHDDLNEGNVLVDRDGVARVTDWGDCSIGHPFGVLLVTLRVLRASHGLDDRGAQRLTDAYLEPWGGAQHREAAALAQRLQAPARALAWERALAGADAAERAPWQAAVTAWWGEVR